MKRKRSTLVPPADRKTGRSVASPSDAQALAGAFVKVWRKELIAGGGEYSRHARAAATLAVRNDMPELVA